MLKLAYLSLQNLPGSWVHVRGLGAFSDPGQHHKSSTYQATSMGTVTSEDSVVSLFAACTLEPARKYKVYPIDVLLKFNKSLRVLTCPLQRFTSEALHAGILRGPLPVGPKDEVSTEDDDRNRRSELFEIADYTLIQAASKAELPNREGTTTPPPVRGMEGTAQKDPGFAQFLKEFSSPTHNRVTAGGHIVPADTPRIKYGGGFSRYRSQSRFKPAPQPQAVPPQPGMIFPSLPLPPWAFDLVNGQMVLKTEYMSFLAPKNPYIPFDGTQSSFNMPAPMYPHPSTGIWPYPVPSPDLQTAFQGIWPPPMGPIPSFGNPIGNHMTMVGPNGAAMGFPSPMMWQPQVFPNFQPQSLNQYDQAEDDDFQAQESELPIKRPLKDRRDWTANLTSDVRDFVPQQFIRKEPFGESRNANGDMLGHSIAPERSSSLRPVAFTKVRGLQSDDFTPTRATGRSKALLIQPNPSSLQSTAENPKQTDGACAASKDVELTAVDEPNFSLQEQPGAGNLASSGNVPDLVKEYSIGDEIKADFAKDKNRSSRNPLQGNKKKQSKFRLRSKQKQASLAPTLKESAGTVATVNDKSSTSTRGEPTKDDPTEPDLDIKARKMSGSQKSKKGYWSTRGKKGKKRFNPMPRAESLQKQTKPLEPVLTESNSEAETQLRRIYDKNEAQKSGQTSPMKRFGRFMQLDGGGDDEEDLDIREEQERLRKIREGQEERQREYEDHTAKQVPIRFELSGFAMAMHLNPRTRGVPFTPEQMQIGVEEWMSKLNFKQVGDPAKSTASTWQPGDPVDPSVRQFQEAAAAAAASTRGGAGRDANLPTKDFSTANKSKNLTGSGAKSNGKGKATVKIASDEKSEDSENDESTPEWLRTVFQNQHEEMIWDPDHPEWPLMVAPDGWAEQFARKRGGKSGTGGLEKAP
ncbi:MAG: hypothetical protein M4579_001153 [Chaenotheca gracillima]|nr:MAG: hypothetical protein M4579_001153 [Chaenotheca gracillima]